MTGYLYAILWHWSHNSPAYNVSIGFLASLGLSASHWIVDRIHRPYLFIITVKYGRASLQWRHNERDGVSNHQPDCLLNRSSTGDRKLLRSASLAFVRGIHRWSVNSPHKGTVTRKIYPFDDVIMTVKYCRRNDARFGVDTSMIARVYLLLG